MEEKWLIIWSKVKFYILIVHLHYQQIYSYKSNVYINLPITISQYLQESCWFRTN